MENRNCLECEREFFGRADKKFCSDACRNAFNNRENAYTSNYIRSVNRKLKKNRQVLEKLNPDGKTTTHKDKLMKAGFDFDYCTNTYLTKDKNEYRFCYEQGYLMLDKGFVLLVKRDGTE